MEQHMEDATIPSLFTVYYMNQQKVFETRMLLDNRLKTASAEENQNGSSNNASLSAEAELNPPFLAKLRAKLDGNAHHERQEKVVDTLEYVNTKSRMLFDIMQHCKLPEPRAKFAEGDLAYIDRVSLELINENEIRSIMTITSGTFDGITVPGTDNFDIGRMMQSFIGNGAAFKIKGTHALTGEFLYAKIPLTEKEMFESGYTIDDLLIGEVGLIGICKGKIVPAQMKSPLDYFQQLSNTEPELQNDIIECDEQSETPSGATNSEPTEKGYYIDILAVVQAVSFEI